MRPATWTYDPITMKDHHEDCEIWKPRTLADVRNCTCPVDESEMIETFTRTPVKSATLSGQPGPHSTLADLIRAARRDGLLRPVQQYGGGHATAASP